MIKLKHWIFSKNKTKKNKKDQLIHALKKTYINKKLFLRQTPSKLTSYKNNLHIYTIAPNN